MEILKQLRAKEKARLVIKSCKTQNHTIVARRFVNLFYKKYESLLDDQELNIILEAIEEKIKQ